MKRVIIPALITLMVLLAVAGCNDESKPEFTRVSISPSCGVVPLQVEGYAIASGGDESGSPTGGNNNLEIEWKFEENGFSFSSISYHSFEEAGEYPVLVTGTDASGNVTTATRMVVVLEDTLKITSSVVDHPVLEVTTNDTLTFDVWAKACLVDPDTPEDYRKLDFLWCIAEVDSTYQFYTQNPVWNFSVPGVYEVYNRVTLASLAVTRCDTLVITVLSP